MSTRVAGSLLFVALSSLLISWWAVPGRMSSGSAIELPREKVTYELALQWREAGEPWIVDQRLQSWPSDLGSGLVPRDAGLVGNRIVPQDSALSVILVALASVGDDRAPFLLTPIGASLLGAGTFLLAYHLSRSALSATLAAVLFVASPWFLSVAGRAVSAETVSAAAIVVATVLAMHVRGSSVRMLLVGALIGVGVGLRYPAILLGIPVLAGAMMAQTKESDRFRFVVWSIAGVIPSVLAVLSFNKWVYGGFFATGYAARRSVVEAFGSSSIGSQVWRHLTIYASMPWMMVLLVLSVAGIVAVRRQLTSRDKSIVLGALSGASFLILVASTRQLWGDDAFTVDASFLRYTAAAGGLLAAVSAVTIRSLLTRTRLWAVLIVVICIGGLAASFRSEGGIMESRHDMLFGRRAQELLVSATDDDALIYVWTSEKWLWPSRTTIVASNLVDRRSAIEVVEERTGAVAVFPSPQHVSGHLQELAAMSSDLYLLVEPRIAGAYLRDLKGHVEESGSLTERPIGLPDGWALESVRFRSPSGSTAASGSR